MTYTILSTNQIEESLFTTVEYNFDGTIVTVEVAHFMPKDTDEITQNIIKRAASEIARLNAKVLIPSIIDELIIGESNPI